MKDSLRPVVVVAGVGNGLGASIARRFAMGGCRVALLARQHAFIAQLAEELNAREAGTAIAISTDLTIPSSVQEAFHEIRRSMGPVHVLINHASGGGESFGKDSMQLDLSDFENAWRVCVMGGLLCSREVIPEMVKNPAPINALYPSILFTGATSSVRGASIAFSSAKFGARGLAQSLARELWPQGIHVAHIVIDGVIADEGTESTPQHPFLEPSAIAESYWHLANQHPSSWTMELDVRPNHEKFFE